MTTCQGLLDHLRSQDIEELREAAYVAGEERCEETVPLLTELLKSHNLGVQEAAELALRKIGGGTAVRAVIPLLHSDDAPVRNLSMDILRQIGDQDFPSMVELLHDDDPDIRIFASDILGSSSSVLAVAHLCESLLKDPEVNVRYQAAVSLGQLARPEAAPCLNKAMGDEEWVQFAVIEALSKIKDESSVSALVKALSNPATSDLVASMIVEALGEMGNVKAAAMLLRRLEDSPTALRNKIVKAIVQILGGKSLTLLSQAERERFRDYLLVALQDEEEDIQDAAIFGLGFVGGEDASAEVLRLAARMDPDREHDRLRRAIDALAGIGLTAATRSVAGGDDRDLSLVAIAVLERIGGVEASQLLIDVFWSKDRDLQREISAALLRVGGAEAKPFFLGVLERHADGTTLKTALKFLGGKMRAEDAGEKVFSLLNHPYDDVKEAALDACVAIDGPAMTERFRRLFDSREPIERLMAVYALGRIHAEDNLEILKQALGDEVPDVRKVALEALGEMSCDTLPLIVSKLGDENRDVRLTVVEMLGKAACADVFEHLMRALADEDEWVRIRAMEAFSERRERQAIPAIVPLLSSSNKLVSLKAVEALGAIGGQTAFRALLDILNGDDHDLIAAAEDAIAKIQEEQGVAS